MDYKIPIVIFTLDEQRYALHCTAVRQILQAVEIPPVPNMSEDQLGVINVEGEIIPIINIRHRLALPTRQLSINDFIVIAYFANNSIGFVVNDIDFSESTTNHEVEMKNDVNIIKSQQGMIYVLDIDHIMQDHDNITTFNGVKKVKNASELEQRAN